MIFLLPQLGVHDDKNMFHLKWTLYTVYCGKDSILSGMNLNGIHLMKKQPIMLLSLKKKRKMCQIVP